MQLCSSKSGGKVRDSRRSLVLSMLELPIVRFRVQTLARAEIWFQSLSKTTGYMLFLSIPVLSYLDFSQRVPNPSIIESVNAQTAICKICPNLSVWSLLGMDYVQNSMSGCKCTSSFRPLMETLDILFVDMNPSTVCSICKDPHFHV